MMGRGDQALAYLHESDRIARACGDLRLALFAASGLGFIYLEAGDFRRAEEWQLRMLELAERDLNPVATASALQNLGLIAVEQERYETAFDRLVRAIELHAPRGDLINASEDINNLGLAYARVGDLAAARRCHAVAAHMALTSSYRIALYLNLANLARIELEEGHADAAERTARAALLGLEETDIPRLRFDALATLAAALDQCGRLGEAAAAARDLLHVAGETGRDDHAFAAWLLSLRLETLSGLLHRSLVVQELGARLAETADPVRRAALHYTLWQLDPSRGGDAAQAAELYRALHVERSTILYRHRFREMTGEELPLPAGTPKLPAAVTSYPGTVEALLAEVKRTLAQPAAS
jgi:tetratricopeptide (TPR) repeat protein